MPNDHAVPTRRPPRSEKVPTFDAQLFLTSVGTGRSTTKYGPQSTIFLQGDPADAVFYVEKGTVQLTVVSEHGREGVIAMPSAGDFFGEGCLAGQPLHIASATAMRKVQMFAECRHPVRTYTGLDIDGGSHCCERAPPELSATVALSFGCGQSVRAA